MIYLKLKIFPKGFRIPTKLKVLNEGNIEYNVESCVESCFEDRLSSKGFKCYWNGIKLIFNSDRVR